MKTMWVRSRDRKAVEAALRAETTTWLRVVAAEADPRQDAGCKVILFPAYGDDAA